MEMKKGWWADNRLRLIQNNLREIDAGMDVDRLIGELEQFGANTLMMNAGGIFAFYPSALEHHYVTPHLKGDLLGEAIEKAHRAGMRFVARFDFSKAHESIYAARPEWFYRSRSGEAVNYYGIMHTCLNGGYQQQYSLAIIGEVLDRYPVDGIFFNMFGYQNWDYSGRHYGICHCDSCKVRFRAMYGLELPASDDPHDPAMRAYRRFQEETARDMLAKIADFVKARRPDVAICTYHHHAVDIVRHESNTSLTRPHPRSPYSAAENVMPVMGSWPGKLISNCSINAVDLAYRFTGVSPEETAIRLYGNMANGSGLDFCIIGAFDGYPDTANFEKAGRIFRFHRDHEALFGQYESVADVILVKPDPHLSPGTVFDEYRGLFRMMKESHLLFDVVEQERLAARLNELPANIVVLPGIAELHADTLEALTSWQRQGGRVLATGGALAEQPAALLALFGAAGIGYRLEETDAAYVQVDDPAMFPALAGRQWLVVDGPFVALADGAAGAEAGGVIVPPPAASAASLRRLPLVAPSTFGPPERAYGHALTDYAGLTIRPDCSAYIGWRIGAYYAKQGFEDVKRVTEAVVDMLLGRQRRLETNAHPTVELTCFRLPDGSHLLQLINLSGWTGVTYTAPVPMRDIEVRLNIGGAAVLEAPSAVELTAKAALGVRLEDGTAILTLPELGEYAAVHIRP